MNFINKNNPFFKTGIFQLSIGLVVIFILVVFSGCKKDDDDEFTANFKYEFKDDNHVEYTNQSEGEYYSITWDFGNGESETTTDKKKVYTIYYPVAGDYEVSLKANGYSGGNQTTKKTVNIAKTDLVVSFTADIDVANPNYVNLKNTTQGTYDSFKWLYRDIEVENETETQAYFPLAGNYEIELQVFKSNNTYSSNQTVTIAQDDPDFIGLVWSDEFDYTGLPDALKWNMETGGGG